MGDDERTEAEMIGERVIAARGERRRFIARNQPVWRREGRRHRRSKGNLE